MLILGKLPQLVSAKYVRSLLNLNETFNKQYRIVEANFGEDAKPDYDKYETSGLLCFYLFDFFTFFFLEPLETLL